MDLIDFVGEFKLNYGLDIKKFLEEKHFKNLVIKHILLDIYNAFYERFSKILASNLVGESVLMLILLFLCNSNRGEIQEQRKLSLWNLIQSCAFEADEGNINFGKYDSGVFSQFIINVIKLCQACLLYFFVGRLFLDNEFDKVDVEDLFIKKEAIGKLTYEGLKEYFNINLKIVNKEVSEESVDDICLPFAFEPIKHCKYN